MRILSPATGAEEARSVIDAGAEELYCGVMPEEWKRDYTNVASPNRREWEVSNMTRFEQLADVVSVAHARQVRVFLAMNALYTEGQYDGVKVFIREAMQAGVDAIIIADMGLLLSVRDMGWERDIHISTGGTAFNSETVAFYKDLGAARVILPRQNRVSEISDIVKQSPDVEIETFIMNRGCKNIDGFCTFHHGVNEVRIPLWWRIPKKLHWDYYLLALMKRLPLGVRETLSHSSMFGSVGACFLSYDIDVEAKNATPEQKETLWRTLRNNYNLFTGFDTCGACAMLDLYKSGVESLKIVGRSNPLPKKVQDVTFLRTCLQYVEDKNPTREDFAAFAKDAYHKVFGFRCDNWCYFPAEDMNVGSEVL